MADFFEDCIKEEQYEAEKLDIMKDAFQATANYKIESKKVMTTRGDSILLEDDVSSPREPTPELLSGNGENGVEVVVAKVVENGAVNGTSNGTHDNVQNGDAAAVDDLATAQ